MWRHRRPRYLGVHLASRPLLPVKPELRPRICDDVPDAARREDAAIRGPTDVSPVPASDLIANKLATVPLIWPEAPVGTSLCCIPAIGGFGVRWSRFPGQFVGVAKVDSRFDYATNFFSLACGFWACFFFFGLAWRVSQNLRRAPRSEHWSAHCSRANYRLRELFLLVRTDSARPRRSRLTRIASARSTRRQIRCIRSSARSPPMASARTTSPN